MSKAPVITKQQGVPQKQPTTQPPQQQAKPPAKVDIKQSQKVATDQLDTLWMEPGKDVWIEQQDVGPDEDAFTKGKLIKLDEKTSQVEVQYPDNKIVTISGSKILERVDFGNTMKEGFEDMVNMETLNDAELMENVKKRFLLDKICTYVGPTLLVINPFKKIEGFTTEECRMSYIKHIIPAKGNALAYKELPPHVYALAAEAYRCLFENEKNQSIVISGESGAGKTENAKFCMSLLTSIGSFELFQHQPDLLSQDKQKATTVLSATVKMVQAQEISIEEKILNCNPVLESFGNSKTKRNNNSSRFGKYVSMVVDKKHRKIRGALITNYLLEKSRITTQGLTERNFHIFYHLIEGSTIDELKTYHLTKPDGKKIDYDWFEFLKKSQNYTSPGIDDVALLKEIRSSFAALGMIDFEASIFKIVSSVLLLGNLQFDGSSFGNDSPCKILNPELLVSISDLLKTDVKQLEKAFTVKNRKVGNQNIDSPLKVDECEVTKDSFAKELYERLFNWLVYKLNMTIKPQIEMESVCIGLLDIYGFEVFEINGFEQLMINYTNEKLHQLYIAYVFKEEERVFVYEDLAEFCCQIKFSDNTPVIELLEKPPMGIFNLLDESCSMASQTDENLIQAIRTKHKDNKTTVHPKIPTQPSFTIVHTAKNVEYNVLGFRMKNKDETSIILIDLMGQSQDQLVQFMFSKSEKGDKYIGTKIRKEMAELMKELNSCDVHFIRCLKPNELKKSNIFHQNMTLNQIRYLGVLDSLKVRKDSYPMRRTFNLFYKQFGDISKDLPYPLLIQQKVDFRPYVERLIKQNFADIGTEHLLIGKTKVFMRQPGLVEATRIYLEKCQFKAKKATMIQRMFRCMKFRQQVKTLMAKFAKLKKQLKFHITAIRMKKYALKIIKLQKFFKKKLFEKNKERLLTNTKVFQKYLKRRLNLIQANKFKKAVLMIQKFIRKILKEKEKRKIYAIKQCLFLALDRAWVQIQTKKAIIIQKNFRGWRVRNKVIGKKGLQQIKEAGRQQTIKRNSLLITRWARGFLVRNRIANMHLAARKIQGYFKMKWLSELFQAMRKHIIIIQRFCMMFIKKKRYYNEKYSRYIVPWEIQFSSIKELENNHLFSQEEQQCLQKISVHQPISPLSSVFTTQKNSPLKESLHESPRKLNKRVEPDFQQSLNQSYQTIQPKQVKEKQYVPSSSWQYNQTESIDSILMNEEEAQILNKKMQLFTLTVDMEILTDISEIYSQPWTTTYKDLTAALFARQSPIQVIEVGETHTIAVSVSGKAYTWGQNDFGQLGHNEAIDRPQILYVPGDFKIKQVSSGENHTLLLGYDGNIWGFGQNTQGQLGNNLQQNSTVPIQIITGSEPIAQVKAIGNSSFAISQSGQLFTWPLSENSRPFQVQFNSKVPIINVTCGNQFAIIMQSNGCLWSFGENLEGELGLGDTQLRTDPCLIEKLASSGEKIVSAECGFKHVVVKTNSCKVFTWGWGERGQLGHGGFSNEYKVSPRLVSTQYKVLQVSASHKSSIFLTEKHKLLWCGTNKTITYQPYLSEIKLDYKSLQLSNTNYVPIRIQTTWSRSLSLINITFANTRSVLSNNIPLKQKLLNQLVTKWVENGIQNIDPPLSDQLANYIQERHMKKPSQTQPKTDTRVLKGSVLLTEQKKNVRMKLVNDGGYFSERRQRASNAGQKQAKQESETTKEILDNTNLSKLREIKKRLTQLKSVPETQWSDKDIEFIRTIYKSNLSKLLTNFDL